MSAADIRGGAALVVFLATVAAIVMRPSKVQEWLAGTVGVIAMLAFGVESPADAWQAVASQWNVLLFFAGLMTIVAIAESAGFFSWIAFVAARAAQGSARRLFVAVMVSCACITALLTNDAAALVMTPLIFSLASGLRLRPLRYAFACTFMANGASVLLPISNPVNVMIANAATLPLSQYLSILWLPGIAAAVATGAMLWVVLGRRIRRRFDESMVAEPEGDPRYRSEVVWLLLLIAGSLIAVTAERGAVGIAACCGAVVLIAHGVLRGRLQPRRVFNDANPGIVVLVAALFALAEGVVKSGLLSWPTQSLVRISDMHVELAGVAAALATAVGSNILNNLPTAALAAAALHHAPITVAIEHRIAAGTIVGCDLGPNLTTVGSLSTLVWLVLLRRRGLEVSPLEYSKVGLLIAPVAIAAAVSALWFTTR